ncbi:MAG TPA: hypothetical protein VHC98_00640 [Candidatus Saccharimonadales bacterium]|nr:hypothetical protein [Candidatus Saccharimonadales bacterium]
MSELLLHESTRRALDAFVAHPSHGLLLTAPAGGGKATVAAYVAARLLGIEADKLPNHAHVKTVRSADGKAISIEAIRDVIHFTTLRAAQTNNVSSPVNRIIIIEQAALLTAQAQNALLKTIEEPPAGTLIILTAPSEVAILPTIRSRIQHIAIQTPDSAAVCKYFVGQGYAGDAVQKALLMSGGLPGLMQALLTADRAHPLLAATARARDVLQKTPFERLLIAEELAKDRQQWLDTLFILSQMADISLRQGKGQVAAARRWQRILTTCHHAQEQTQRSAQLKLVLLNFMLAI